MKKWMAGVLAGLLCLAGFAGEARAQVGPNLPGYFVAFAIGAPGYVLNSNGTNYGEIFNSSGANASTTWNLGYGTASSFLPNGQPAFASNGTAVLSWNSSQQAAVNLASDAILANNVFQVNTLAADVGEYFFGYNQNGWLEFHAQQAAISGSVAASVPTTGNCGTGGSVTVSGTDVAGDITLAANPSATCDIFFASTPTNIPHCFCNDIGTASQNIPCSVQNLSKNGFNLTALGAKTGNADIFSANDRLDWICLGHS